MEEVLLRCLPLPGSLGGHQPGPPRDPGGVPRIHAEEGVRGHWGGLGGEDTGDTLGPDYPSLTDLTLQGLWPLFFLSGPPTLSSLVPQPPGISLPPTLAFIPFP